MIIATLEERTKSFLEKVREFNPNIKVIGKYVNGRSRIECMCDIHKQILTPVAKNLLNRHICPECYKETMSKKLRLPQEEFINRLNAVHPHIEVLGEYINQSTPIKCRCKIHNFEWENTPTNLLHGSNCLYCTLEDNSVTHGWDKERFYYYMKNERPEIQVCSEYIDNKNKIDFKCNICGHEWKAAPNNIKNGSGCPECGKRKIIEKRALSEDDVKQRISTINKDIELIGCYVSCSRKTTFRCNIHNHTWESTPHNILQGHGCPICGKEKQIKSQTMTHDEFVARMKEIHPTIEVIGKYINSDYKVKCKCSKHNHIWDGQPGNLLSGSGCYYCGKESMGILQSLTQEEYESRCREANPNITIIGKYNGRKNKIKCKCNICNYEWKSIAFDLFQKRLCPLCSNRVVVKDINDIATTHPYLVNYFKNIEDCYNHCCTNSSRVTFKCPVCGDENDYAINAVIKNGFRCYYCDKSVSKPNRMIRNLIRLLPVDRYEIEYSPDWVGKCRYDMYFEYKGTPYIVEMDGGFHFKWAEKMGITEEDFIKTCQRDRMKDRLAAEHDITMIRIKCDPSTIKYISSQIQNSLLADIFDLSNIDWNGLLYRDTQLVKKICDAFNSLKPISITKLAKEINIERHTVSHYLKWGATIGLC